MRKPETPARETIAPSDLTFGLSTCKRCLWLKYWFKFELKKEFPLVKPLADSQEEHFRRAPLQSLHPSLKPGVVKQWGQWVKSAPISINGFETRWKILGIYDLLGHYEDGTVAIIDCKVSDSDRDNGPFYAPQLESYAYAWKLAGVTETRQSELASNSHGFGVNQHYVPVERDSATFMNLLEELITTIEGGMPDPGPECNVCNYLIKRVELEID